MRFAVDPVVLILIALACWLYLRALGIVRARNLNVPRGQQACWWIGIALLTIGLNGPLDAYDADLLSAHMAQHLLLGDLAGPFLLAGLRAPMLFFYLPRPALVLLAQRHGLRRAFRFLRRPLVALPVYVLAIYAWHSSILFEGAIGNPFLHALQHESFLAANLLLWWAVLEPTRRRMPGQLWKIGYIFAARMATMFLGMIFVFARPVLYEGVYGHGTRVAGFSPYTDQRTAGGMMMVLDIVMMLTALAWFFWHASKQEDRDQAAALANAQAAPGAAPSERQSPPATARAPLT